LLNNKDFKDEHTQLWLDKADFCGEEEKKVESLGERVP